MNKKGNVLFAAFAALFFALSLFLCSYGLQAGTVFANTEGDPEACVQAFFTALEEERYEEAYAFLTNFSSLGLEQGLSDPEGQDLVVAVRKSIAWTMEGTCQVEYWQAEQVVSVSFLSIHAMQEDLKELVQKNVENAAKTRQKEEVFDKDYNYLEPFAEEIYQASLQELLARPADYRETEKLTLHLEYSDNFGWQIRADDALVRVLYGKMF